MYIQTPQGAARRQVRRKSDKSRREQNRAASRRLSQLLICLAIFLTVFVGKGVFPQRMALISREAAVLLGQNTDFRAAFLRLGQALGGGDSVLGQVGELCIAVFGTEQTRIPWPEEETMAKKELRFLASGADYEQVVCHYLRMEELPENWKPTKAAEEKRQETVASVPAVGTVLLQANYMGRELPEGYTMDHISLGDLATVTPVFGPVRSPFGYRDHPINGAYKFHNGIDIGAGEGEPILAFAGGQVEYTGESEVYGNYLQLDHGNGIKSFYAHCSQVLVRTGQKITAGERIALVGSTGAVTGPHLHLELRCGDLHLDPAYYIQTEAAV